MKAWLVTCDSCPYRERFLTLLDAEHAARQHVHYWTRHKTNVNEDER